MSNIDWTKEQNNVINTRDKSILVAAGAGSGKTTVLVERIIKMITDKQNPIDIDRFLIVTFTRSAAAQMKEKIRDSLYKLLLENPKDQNIRRQMSLIHTANISTIDSFANKIVSEHFEDLDIDPNFRVMEQEECDMLIEDCIDEVLEEYYESDDKEFMEAIEMLAEGSPTANISEDIKSIIDKANNQAFPKLWLKKAKDLNTYESLDQFEKSVLVRNVMDDFESYKEFDPMLDEGYHFAEEGATDAFLKAMEVDYNTLQDLRAANTFDEYRDAVLKFESQRITASKFEGREVAAEAHYLLKGYSEHFTGGKDKGNYSYFPTLQEAFDDVNKSQKLANVLIEIAAKVIEKSDEYKRYISAYSFNDIAHFALEIICDVDEKGNISPSDIAKEMSEQFYEILIDEYQDSNEIQEYMLTSLSKKDKYNLFMVGDVKQSIYRFRSAEPDIFLAKYDTFSEDMKSNEVKINLDYNFRSRPEIINSTNRIFRSIMREPVGGINYKDEADLVYGAKKTYNLDVNSGKNDNRTEYVCVSSEEKSRHECEAEFIAKRIKELMADDGLKITNKDEKERALSYKDIVILTKAPATVVDTYIKVLEDYGIPVFGEKKYGFYEATEIKTILDLLRIIDNPIWDIPLVGVMTSELFDFNEEELSSIRMMDKDAYFYEALQMYVESGSDSKLITKINNFLSEIDDFRRKSKYLSVYELIEYILGKSYFEHYIKALPIGARRKMNVDMLKEIAYSFEETSYRGLFNFIRYIDKNIENDQDMGEAVEVGEEDDVVRIVSIHKSKGLEYPVVFLANANYSKHSDKKDYFVDKQGDIATYAYNTEEKTRTKTLVDRFIRNNEAVEQKAEELRLLYVAMTRAKEKLIIISSYKGEINDKAIEKFKPVDDEFFVDTILNASNYHQMIAPVLGKDIIEELPKKGYSYEDGINEYELDDIRFYVIPNLDAYDTSIEKETGKEELNDITDQKIVETITENFGFEYPYEKELKLRSKMSVTEIKRRLSREFVDEDAQEFIPNRSTNVKPNFVEQNSDSELTGAERGNVYHKIFELLDYTLDFSDDKAINDFLDGLVKDNKLTEKERESVDNKTITDFTNSDIYGRMKAAFDRKELYRECKFLMQVDGGFIKEVQGIETKETMIVQGIIDALFKEEGKYVVVDYKTDRVDDSEKLVKEYGNQLKVYKKAVEKITNEEVKDMIIYSVELGEEAKV